MLLMLKRANNPLFVRRREAREDLCSLRGHCQFVVGHRFDLGAQENVVGIKPHLTADFAGNQIIVAGQDFHGDAVSLQRLDSLCGRVLRGIEEGDVAFEDQVALVLFIDERLIAQMLVGDGEDTEAIGAEFLVVLDQISRQHWLQWQNFSVEFIETAAWEDGLRRALG